MFQMDCILYLIIQEYLTIQSWMYNT